MKKLLLLACLLSTSAFAQIQSGVLPRVQSGFDINDPINNPRYQQDNEIRKFQNDERLKKIQNSGKNVGISKKIIANNIDDPINSTSSYEKNKMQDNENLKRIQNDGINKNSVTNNTDDINTQRIKEIQQQGSSNDPSIINKIKQVQQQSNPSDPESINRIKQVQQQSNNRQIGDFSPPKGNDGKYDVRVGNVFVFCSSPRPSRFNPMRSVYDDLCSDNQSASQPVRRYTPEEIEERKRNLMNR